MRILLTLNIYPRVAAVFLIWFKTSFEKEKYLEFIPYFPLRKCLTKFRCSDHRLEIEIGRHNNIDASARWCKICVTEVETEEHFLRFCPGYNNLRLHYFGTLETFLQWRNILMCTDRGSTFRLINFIRKAFQLRNDGLGNRNAIPWLLYEYMWMKKVIFPLYVITRFSHRRWNVNFKTWEILVKIQ